MAGSSIIHAILLLLLLLLPIFGSCQDPIITSTQQHQHQYPWGSSYLWPSAVDDDDLFHDFTFYSDPDPTHGFVQYVSQQEASYLGLIDRDHDDGIVIRAENRTRAPNGRPSVRLESKQVFNGGTFVFDIEHMPEGCGTWPALWLLGPDWPKGGEIDIVEGVNLQRRNRMSLHTGPGCSIPNIASPHQKGHIVSTECDGSMNNNTGCSIEDSSRRSYGQEFNAHGGGVFVVQWKVDESIIIWFFDRHHQRHHQRHQTPFWDQLEERPSAVFDLKKCPRQSFRDMRLIINLTFCGDWAGKPSGVSNNRCPRDCVAHVRNRPNAFTEAYWRIRSIEIFPPS